MKNKKRSILAGIAVLAMMAMATPAMAEPGERGPMPGPDDMFWQIFAQMATPDDYPNCVAALEAYIAAHPDEFFGPQSAEEERHEMTEMCTQVGLMRTEMQAGMTGDGVETSLFNPANTNWHAVDGLYFQKSENGAAEGRISFTETVDFMSYRFFNFMNNFGNMVQFNDGYISVNASMVPDMINYGATLTMFGLEYGEVPDIYVSNGSEVRKAIEGTDVSGISYNATTGELTFTPGHFSSFKVVEKGAGLKTMRIRSVNKKAVTFRAGRTFTLTVKGKNLFRRGSDVSCTLGFQQAEKVHAGRAGKKVKCTFGMDSFTQGTIYPLTVSIIGTGEVTKTAAVTIR